MDTSYLTPKLPTVVIRYPSDKKSATISRGPETTNPQLDCKKEARELAKILAKRKDLRIELGVLGCETTEPIVLDEETDLTFILQTEESFAGWKHKIEGSPEKWVNVHCQNLAAVTELGDRSDSIQCFEDKDKGISKSPFEIIERIKDQLSEQFAKIRAIDVVVVTHNQRENKAFDKVKTTLNALKVESFDNANPNRSEPKATNADNLPRSAIYSARCLVVLRSTASAEDADRFLGYISKVRGGIVVINLSRSLPKLNLPVLVFDWPPNYLESFYRDTSLGPICEQIEFCVDNPITVFIAYSSEDSARMFSLKNALELSGFKVLSDQIVRTGKYWEAEITEFMLCADTVVGMISQNSIKSEPFEKEVKIADDQNLLIPVRLDNVEIPEKFQRFGQATELYNSVQPFQDCLIKINDAILQKCRNDRALVIHDFGNKEDDLSLIHI